MTAKQRNFSPQSLAVIQYRLDNKYLPLEAIGKPFNISRSRTHAILKSAGVQTASVKYEGMDCHVRNVPKEVVDSVKARAKSDGMTFRLRTILMWKDYGEGK